MNHIFRTVWSEAMNAWVAVSEFVSAKGKRSGSSALNAVLNVGAGHARDQKIRGHGPLLQVKLIALVAACCFGSNAQANPIGAEVLNGTAAINQTGNILTVTNSPSAIINWQGFSINPNETTNFVQQSAASSVLNRVVGADPSQLLGALTSNGKVFLINPAGILVGQGARIDVAGFVASALNLSNADFLAGKLNFTSPLPLAGEGPGERAGAIQNNGTITTPEGGSVYLIAPDITNEGIITTPGGETLLAAGNTVQLIDTGTPGVTVQVTGSDNSATNLGHILADSGRIGMVGAVVRNSGTVSASSLISEGGRVFLKATQRVEVTGAVTASSTTAPSPSTTLPSPSGGGAGGEGALGSGGSIDISAPSVALGGTIAADGSTQGGNITIAAGGASLAGVVSATGGSGQGGSIAIESQTTNLNNVHATLDASGANGGSIREIAGQQITSSATYLVTGTAGNGGHIDLSAPATKLLSAQIDASGATNGGQIRVGGEYQGGKSPSPSPSASLLPLPLAGEGWGGGRISTPLPNAETLAISAGSTIKADGGIIPPSPSASLLPLPLAGEGWGEGVLTGNGGTIILWSDLESALYANVSAQPAGSGQGGFIELSSAEKLVWGGTANAGVGGQVLIDPKNIVIQDATAGGVQYNLTLGYNYLNLPRMKGNNLEADDNFGSAVSLSGTQLAVGAYGDDGSGNVSGSSGAVYLFNNPYTTPTLSGIIGKGYTGTGNYDLAALEVGDYFGFAVSLSGTQLAVGAAYDDGSGNVYGNSGAVYLFNNPFTTPTMSGVIGKGYTGTGNYDLTALEALDYFGYSVSLSGTQLAVGAIHDDGSGNAVLSSGAVYLFNNPFGATALSGTIGKGYIGTGDFNLTALQANDYFGSAVSLSGTQLAVGAFGDAGSGNVASGSGAVYLFNTPFTTPTLSGIIGKGYIGAGDFNLTALEASDWFGSAVSLSGTQLAVGASYDDGFGNLALDSGAVYLLNNPFGATALSGTIGNGYIGAGDFSLTVLEASDWFGSSVSLSGTQLAVGAYLDDGSGNAALSSGAVYLFNNPFTTPTLYGIIGKGYTGAGNFDPGNALAANDYFGSAVSLSGTQLAVGASGDDGSDNAVSFSGAVYLFDNPYTTPTLSGIIGKGYTGAGNYDLTTLEANDGFGSAVSLSGTQLAVGAYDGGFGNAATYSGAVYLFNNPYSTPTLSGVIGKGYSGAGNYDLAALEVDDYFGSAVSLSGTQLAVGATGDGGSGNVAWYSGAVYLFDNPYTVPTLSGIIGKGYSSAGDYDLAALGALDYFGSAVSLSGTQLAVGARRDSGSGNVASDSGAVYLFNNPFGATALSGTIGRGYIGTGDYDLTALQAYDNFGFAVSLSGTQLAVGARGDAGSGNVASYSGAVYLFDNPYTTPTLSGIIGKGYTGAGDYDLTALEASDHFGFAVSLSGTQLAVGAIYDDGSGNSATDSGAVYLFTLGAGGGDPATGQTFAANSALDSTITPASIAAILDTGSALTLQANNDITLMNAIIANNLTGNGGALTMQAGRSILVNANINTDNGALTLIANDPGADLAYRDAGAAQIALANGVVLNAGTGSVTVTNTGAISITGTIAATGAINLTALGATGSITESGLGLINTTGLLTTSSAMGQTLNGANTVGSFDATNTTSGNIALNNTAVLDISSISNPVGDVFVTNTGSVSTSGNITASGTINIAAAGGDLNQLSGIISNAFGVAAAGLNDVTLGGANVTLQSVQSQRHVVLNATSSVNLLGLGSGSFIDDTYFVYNLPFAFNYFGTSYSQAYITTNGLIMFGSGTDGFTDSLASLGSYKAIAPAWNDWMLNASLGKDIHIGFGANDMKIRYDVVRYGNTSLNAQFEAILNSNGAINFNYGAANSTFAGDVTIGISNGTGTAIASQLMSQPSFNLNNLVSTTFTPNGSGGYTETLSAGNTALSPAGAISGSAILGQGVGEVVTAAFGRLGINAGGAINAPSQVSAQSLQFVSSGGASFTGTNHFGAIFSASNSTSGDITFYNTAAPLTITTLTNSGGNVVIDNTGGIVVNGALSSLGTFDMTAHSPITVNSGASISSGGNITLTAVSSAVNSMTDLLSIAGTVSSTGGNINLGGGSGVDLATTASITASMGSITAISPYGAINVNGAVSAASINGQGSGITLGHAITASGTGNAIVLDAGAGSFINNAGAVAFSAPNGRWLVYAANPGSVAKGGLTSAFRQYGTVHGGTIHTTTGNGFIYASAAGTLSVNTTLASVDTTHVYGQTPTATWGYTLSGTLADSEDTFANIGVGGTALFNAPTSGSNVGSYNIAYLNGLTSTVGYSFAAGTPYAGYTITPAALTVAANAATKTYDGLVYTGGNGVAYTGLVNGETSAVLGGTLAYSGTSQGATNAGSYVITPNGLTSGNYTLSYVDGQLTVNKAALAVAANAATKTYDGLVYTGGNGVAYTGLVNGETSAVLGGVLAYSGTSQGATNAGSYLITPGGLTSGNYLISFINGLLTITPLISPEVTQTVTAVITTATESATTGATALMTTTVASDPAASTAPIAVDTSAIVSATASVITGGTIGGTIGGTPGTFGGESVTVTTETSPAPGSSASGSENDSSQSEGNKEDATGKDDKDQNKDKANAKPEKC